jgi:hypothetical protein
MDIYQSRLPAETVYNVMNFQRNAESFPAYMQTFPEFFCRVQELEIELTAKALVQRREIQTVACELLASTLTSSEKLLVSLNRTSTKKSLLHKILS